MPLICERERPVTRLSVAPAPFSKRTLLPAPTEKLPQLMMAVREPCVITMLDGEGDEMAACPDDTLPPAGNA